MNRSRTFGTRGGGKPKGFTLIELVIVITIIGILAAVALPRLIDAQRDARIAKLHAIRGSLKSASALARARCEMDLANIAASVTASDCRSTPPMVNMDGHLVRVVSRHPAASADGIDIAADLNLAADGLTATSATGTNNGITVPARAFDVLGGTSPNCRVTYLEGALNGAVIVAPDIQVADTGC